MTCNGTLNGRTLNPSQFNPIRCTTLLVLLSLPHAVNCARFCFWCHLSVVFCLCMKCLGEPLNGFVPNSDGRRVWSLTQTSLKVKVTRDKKLYFSALLAACVRFMFSKTFSNFCQRWLKCPWAHLSHVQ